MLKRTQCPFLYLFIHWKIVVIFFNLISNQGEISVQKMFRQKLKNENVKVLFLLLFKPKIFKLTLTDLLSLYNSKET